MAKLSSCFGNVGGIVSYSREIKTLRSIFYLKMRNKKWWNDQLFERLNSVENVS